MITTISTIVGVVGSIAASIIAYKNSANRQRRAAEKDIQEKEEEMRSKKDEIRSAVYSNDESKINSLVSNLISHSCALIVLSLLLGCSTKTSVVQYIPTDRHIEPCTNSFGIACQAVPNAVFCEFLEKAQELKYIKTEMAVDKRLQK